jgi:hypothetical protein
MHQGRLWSPERRAICLCELAQDIFICPDDSHVLLFSVEHASHLIESWSGGQRARMLPQAVQNRRVPTSAMVDLRSLWSMRYSI